MKKLAIYLLIIAVLFAIVYFLNQESKKANDDQSNAYGILQSKLNPATVAQLSDPNYQNITTPAKLKEQLKQKGGVFVYFFSSVCMHCIATTPVLMPIVNEMKVDMKKYNLLEFNDGWTDYNIEATPTLIYFKDGEEVERMVGGIPQGYTQGDTKPKEGQVTGYYPEDFKAFFEKYNGS